MNRDKLTVPDLDKITFQELNILVERWLQKTEEFTEIFANQSDELDRIAMVMEKTDTKFCVINRKLSYLRAQQEYNEKMLIAIEEDCNAIDRLLNRLEIQSQPMFLPQIGKDHSRSDMYVHTHYEIDKNFFNV